MISIPATPPVLAGRRVALRPPQPSDKQDRLVIGRDSEYARMVGDDRENLPLSIDDVDRWHDWLASQDLGWVIDLDGRCIGEARLHHLSQPDRRARYAVGIFDASLRGRGIGAETTRLVLQYAFDTLGLHRVDLRVLEYNTRAIASYAKCGFVREGLERESAYIDGEWHNDVMMAILDREFHDLMRG